MHVKQVPLALEKATEWAARAQLCFLDALMADPEIRPGELAFHGGTSLHFAWNSPRRSEDLDFLIAYEQDLTDVIERARAATESAFQDEHPDMTVEIKDKSSDPGRMLAYHLCISHPQILGKTRVKIEFWKVDPGYLKRYPVRLSTAEAPDTLVARFSNPVPAATLQAAYSDKLAAFATRPFLKWRDIFDLWWVGTQHAEPPQPVALAEQFLHNLSAYQTVDALPPAAALRRFLDYDSETLCALADPELRKWVSENLWRELDPDQVRAMVAYARRAAAAVADAVDALDPGCAAAPRRPRPR